MHLVSRPQPLWRKPRVHSVTPCSSLKYNVSLEAAQNTWQISHPETFTMSEHVYGNKNESAPDEKSTQLCRGDCHFHEKEAEFQTRTESVCCSLEQKTTQKEKTGNTGNSFSNYSMQSSLSLQHYSIFTMVQLKQIFTLCIRILFFTTV